MGDFVSRFSISLRDVNFELTYEEFCNIIKHRKWSSPGPDRVHYVFWACLSLGTEVLWEVRKVLLRGVPPGLQLRPLGVFGKSAREIR